ncbi:MAG: preprotein translocase subunit SecA [Candidatus Amulumruptor caecigallinarius]|nr:preprotein translocase subunit SecA [Candidatus Amulumruptor caecigallinarius]MCM1396225.1 preprotein translocase subunit SecA [Candidatus Amulumruptor caecigallinarius]MCM1453775.1 preprotein translocase subunit SecA [bacterium]
MSLTSFLSKIFGNKSQRDLREIQPILNKIKAEIPAMEKLSNDELRQKITDVRADIAAATKADREFIDKTKAEIETLPFDKRQPLWDEIDRHDKQILDTIEAKLNEHLPVVFAAIRETAARFAANEIVEVTATQLDRDLAAQGRDFVTIEGDKALYKNHWMAGGNEITWDMVHYEVQLIGGIVLHQGKIAEMATGEGKTLVATLPVFLRSLSGKGVHVVTVNDYLSKRDSEWMGPLYMFHGSTVDCIDKHQPNTAERRAAYECDITFGTNNEFGFDYLRDNMAMSPDDMVQRKHYYAIVDEVDSVLIDDARTPLIISGPVPKGDDQLFDEYRHNVEKVVEAQRRLVTRLLSEAKTKLASEDKEVRKDGALQLFRAYKGLPKNGALIKFLSQEGMKNILLETEAYYLQDNEREMPKATEPLYFVIDEKNRSVDLTDKGIDELTGKSEDPTFFVLPDIAAQLSETEHIADAAERQARKDELMQEYAVKAERVHTVAQLLKAYTLFEKDVEYVIDDNKIKIVDEQTGRIMEGRRYSDGLHQAIEAKEGVKVEAATQTFATITLQNYFRMYHKLAGMTGTAETEAGELWDIYKLDVVTIPTNRPVARIDMNDRVYKTKKEKYAAVIEEIESLIEAGRPVLVGTTSVEISELLSRMLTIRHIPHNVLNAKLHQKEAEIVALAGKAGTVTIATNMAGRGTDIKLPADVKDAGGLAIIGTERHESRRVDRQLRGRAGRQGDPGSSVFYVSFEDQLMRLFATDRVMKMLDTLGLEEGERIESGMVTRAIENAQKRVEENNFGIRKRLLEYDDVMNKQRTYIYNRRHHALLGERVGIDIANMLYDFIENLVITYDAPGDYDELSMQLLKVLTIEAPFTDDEFRNMSKEEKIDRINDAAVKALDRKSERIIEVALPVIKDCVENRGLADRIIVPITDGKRIFNLRVDLMQAYDTECRSIVKEWHKAVLLVTIDELWKEHLRELDQLRQSVQNASYEQKDPLVIYKVESFHLFEQMLNQLNAKAMSALMRGQIYIREPEPRPQQEQQESRPAPQVRQAAPERKTDYSGYTASKASLPGEDANRAAAAGAGQRPKPMPARAALKVGRNDPCPCGSGKKFKNCHGRGQV